MGVFFILLLPTLKKMVKRKEKKNQFSILGSMWICLCSCIRKSLTVTGCQNIIIRLIEVESPTSAAISPAAITQHGGGDIVKNIYSILNDLSLQICFPILKTKKWCLFTQNAYLHYILLFWVFLCKHALNRCIWPLCLRVLQHLVHDILKLWHL